jgi:hypothetical protein
MEKDLNVFFGLVDGLAETEEDRVAGRAFVEEIITEIYANMPEPANCAVLLTKPKS